MLELLLKQLGINSATIKAQIEGAPAQLSELINYFKMRLDTHEKKLDDIINRLNEKDANNVHTPDNSKKILTALSGHSEEKPNGYLS